MSDGEPSNEAPISKEEWQHFHGFCREVAFSRV
jgi:hypothetical protein